MAGITLAQAEARLTEYLDAESKALTRERYKIANRELQSASLESIREGVTYWDAKVKELTSEATTGSTFGFHRGIVG